jgi:hypothetical protein
MTPEKTYTKKNHELLDEICENTRAIRRVSNRILDHLHEYQTGAKPYQNGFSADYGQQEGNEDEFDWDFLNNNDDMYL